MNFLYPIFLWLLIPLVIFLWRNSNKLVIRIHLIVLMLIVFSLARPIIKQAPQEAYVNSKNMIIALDASYSMQSKDLVPTRYGFAKQTIKALLEENPTHNVMLMVFTSNPLILSPPTTDHRLVNIALQSLNPDFILTKGTSLKKLFKKIVSLDQEHVNFVLVTDGGEESHAKNLSVLLQDSNIHLSILALGSTRGITIQNKKGGLLKDKNGDLVVSRINPMLKLLASSLGGNYIEASNTPKATAQALNAVMKKNDVQEKQVKKITYHNLELYQIPLLLATLLFLTVHTRAIRFLIIVSSFLGISHASVLDEYYLHLAYKNYDHRDFNSTLKQLKKIKQISLQSQFVLASTHYRQKNYKKSIKVYTSLQSTSIPVKRHIYYNIANNYSMLGIYSKAKIYYTKSLQLGFDEAATYNLHLISHLTDKNQTTLGMTRPKSQNSSESKSNSQKEPKETSISDNQSSSGSGIVKRKKEKKNQIKNKSLENPQKQKLPLGSKVYELMNKGYIRETKPW